MFRESGNSHKLKKTVRIMDKILKITTAVLILGIIGFGSYLSWIWFAAYAYHSSQNGTFSYSLNITTDSPITNMTLFIPVPESRGGNSFVIEQFSSHSIGGIPPGWETTLYSTGKSTLVKITAHTINLPNGTTPQNPYNVAIAVQNSGPFIIETKSPLEQGIMFRSIENEKNSSCPTGVNGDCYSYDIPVYADYIAPAGSHVAIASSFTGRNDWKILEPDSNEFYTDFSLSLTGEHHGWAQAQGMIAEGIGSYNYPA